MMYSAACLLVLAALSAHEANGQAPVAKNEANGQAPLARKGKKKQGQGANVFHVDFPWQKASKDSDFDFYGELEMCGGEATKAVWPEYWYGPDYVDGCVDILSNDGSAPDCPNGYRYGLSSQETFAYRLPGDTSECGSKNAPLIRLIPGKKYKIIFINSTKSVTNLHTHGLHIDGNGYADDAFRQVNPGMCLEYHWDIYEHHMAGLHWYHPHKHHYTYETVKGGAYGLLLVEETKESLKTYPKSVQKWLDDDHQVLLQVGKYLNPSPLHGLGTKCIGSPQQCTVGKADNNFPLCSQEECRPIVNGKILETVTIVKGEWYRIIFANVIPNGTGGDAIKFFANESGSTEKSSCEVLIAGYDGVYRTEIPRTNYPEEIDYFESAGASRLDLAVRCTEDAFVKSDTKESSPHDWGIDDLDNVGVVVNLKVVEGMISEASPWADEENEVKWVPPRPDYLQNFCEEEPEEYWTVHPRVGGEGGNQNNEFLINDLTWNGEVPLHTMTYDTVQEWNFVGTAGHPTGHPMHTHIWHQQICGTGKSRTDSCGLMMEYGQFIDNVKIDNNNNDPCYTRFKTVRFSGKVILHCHDLMHEDVDMMGWVDTVGGPENLPPQPEASCDALRNQPKGKSKKGAGKKGAGKRPKTGNAAKDGTKE